MNHYRCELQKPCGEKRLGLGLVNPFPRSRKVTSIPNMSHVEQMDLDSSAEVDSSMEEEEGQDSDSDNVT